jgi:hypothetical protein
MPKISLIAVAVTALAVGNATASRMPVAPYPGVAAPSYPPAQGQAAWSTACAEVASERRIDAEAAAGLPNAYMTANGRVFALGDALTCAVRLHATRFN